MHSRTPPANSQVRSSFGYQATAGTGSSCTPLTSRVPGALSLPTHEDVQSARHVIHPYVHPTPLLWDRALSATAGYSVYLKAEQSHHTGSYKVRGAHNKVARLTAEQRECGVVTASLGNHAQAVALAAATFGVSARVYMPANAKALKVRATQQLGAEVVLTGASMNDAILAAQREAEASGRVYISAFDDAEIIAGQGTMGLEILETLPKTDAIVAPVGGGGLLAGLGLALKAQHPSIQLIGVEASNMPSMRAALASGRPVTLPAAETYGDGVNVNKVGELTFPLAQAYLDHLIEISEDEMKYAMAFLYATCHLVAEGAGALGVAALLFHKLDSLNLVGKNVVLILSGRNVPLDTLQRLQAEFFTAQS